MSEQIDRPGKMETASDYKSEEWKDRGIRARMFRPCPHCGGAVSARERIWTPPYSDAQAMIFRQARCTRKCGWGFARMGGSREDFVAAVNRRAEDEEEEQGRNKR